MTVPHYSHVQRFIGQLKAGTTTEGRVLVVDNEADVRQTIRLTLTKAGFDVVEAEDGQAGIEAIPSGDQATIPWRSILLSAICRCPM